ncbi:MAG: carbon monoxide dehydrogenase subunit G [Boseongicola sp.]|nr:carbon monoxide dehydrogenase subunit G [Boseongicola sp.]
MKIEGTETLSASPQSVWDALYDPEVLQSCIPGCEEIVGFPKDGSVDIVVLQKVGPVKARFRGTITLDDVEKYKEITLNGVGKGGAAGFVRGTARVQLGESDSGTELIYDAELRVGGKIAQIGSRLIGGFARRFTNQCFKNLRTHMQIDQ